MIQFYQILRIKTLFLLSQKLIRKKLLQTFRKYDLTVLPVVNKKNIKLSALVVALMMLWTLWLRITTKQKKITYFKDGARCVAKEETTHSLTSFGIQLNSHKPPWLLSATAN